ncbi:glycosyltransferase family 2 protein [Nocardioides sp. NPDC057772]|uniref:glycosyltransferase family 2 protein n=1 Tax=Nocardioides sp. NPDC057772 TaxID=3346245 RepID=UPI00367017C9
MRGPRGQSRPDLVRIAAELDRTWVAASTVGRVAKRMDSLAVQELMRIYAHRAEGPRAWRWAAALAHSVGVAPKSDDELDGALETLLAIAKRDPQLLERHEGELLCHLLVERGRGDDFAAIAPHLRLEADAREHVAIDLVNPVVRPMSTEATWLELINDTIMSGLAPLTLEPAVDGARLFDRLAAAVEPGTVAGPRVTVVISSFQPGPELLVSVRSIVAQTWRDLEILVIDDASGDGFAAIYEEVTALDPRVRVITQEQNGGTYVARNRAIDEATGVYVTFQDSDDWAHPERIEREVAALESQRSIVAVRTMALKLSDDLVVSRRQNVARQAVAPTLMFRKDQVWPLLGSFDPVRKAADTEFHFRIEAAFGDGTVIDLDEPLQFMRMSAGSLSRDEFRRGWRHPARMVYRSALLAWHDEIRHGASPFLGRDRRAFPAARRFQLAPDSSPEYDLVVLGDWRQDGPRQREAADWISRLATPRAAAPRIALVHVESLNFERFRSDRYIGPVQDLIAKGAVDSASWDDSLVAKTVVCIDPTTLSFTPRLETGIRAETAVIITDRDEYVDGAPFLTYDRGYVESVVRTAFGADPRWSVRDGGSGPESLGRVTRTPFPAAFAPRQAPRLRPGRGSVVVSLSTVPSKVELDRAVEVASFLVGSGFDVRMRGVPYVRAWILNSLEGQTLPVIFDVGQTTDSVMFATAEHVVITQSQQTVVQRLAAEAAGAGAVVHVPAGSRIEVPANSYLAPEDLVVAMTSARQVSQIATVPSVEQPEAALWAWFDEICGGDVALTG